MLVDNIKQLISESFGETEYKQPPNSNSKETNDIDFDIQFNESDNTITYTTVLGDTITEDATIYEVTIDAVQTASGQWVATSSQLANARFVAGAMKFGVGPLAILGGIAAGGSKLMDMFRNKGISDQESRIVSDITTSASKKLADMRPESTGFIGFLTNMKQAGDSVVDMAKAAGAGTAAAYSATTDAAAKAYGEFTSGVSQLSGDAKDYVIASANGIKDSVNQLEKQRAYHSKILDMIEKSPTDFKNIVTSFFHKYGNNPIIQKLIDISQANPAVFFALLVAIPVIAVGFVAGGTYLVARSISSRSDAQKAIKARENELARTSDSKRRKEIEGELGVIGAKALMLSK